MLTVNFYTIALRDEEGFKTGSSDETTRAFFRDNYLKLQEVKRKYDPDVVFRDGLPILPASSQF